jgi:hypothetical protein
LLLHLIHVLDEREITTSTKQIAEPHKPVADVKDTIRGAVDKIQD